MARLRHGRADAVALRDEAYERPELQMCRKVEYVKILYCQDALPR